MRHAEGAEPADLTSRKIWFTLTYRCRPLHECVDAVELAADLPCHTRTAESQHSRVASLKRHHPDMEVAALLSRAAVGQLRLLMPCLTDEERALKREAAKLAQLRAKNPNKVSGKHLYVKDLFEEANEKVKNEGRQRPADMDRKLMRLHGKHWRKLSNATTCHYTQEAKLYRAESWRILENEKVEILASIQVRQCRIASESCQRKPMVVSECPWGLADLEAFASLSKLPTFSDALVMARRDIILCAPTPPSQDVLDEMHQQDVGQRAERAKPAWLPSLVARRSRFNGTALDCTMDGGRHVLKFLYAKQNPAIMVCDRLKSVDVHQEHVVTNCWDWEAAAMTSAGSTFSNDWGNIVDSWAMVGVPASDINVIQGIRYVGGDLVTEHSPIGLEDYMSRLEPDASRQNSDSLSLCDRPKTDTQLKRELPWLEKDLKMKVPRRVEDQRCLIVLDVNDDDVDDEPPVGEDEVEKMFAKLRSKISDHDEDDWFAADSFSVSGTHDKRSRAHKAGDPSFDGSRAHACGELADSLCKSQVVPVSSSYDLGVYGEATAGVLARAWCHRMQHAINVACARRELEMRVVAADMAGYIEPVDFATLSDTVGIASNVRSRCTAIRRLFS